MHTMPIAAQLTADAVRRQCGPGAEQPYVHDPIRLPRLRGLRRVLAYALHRTAEVVAPSATGGSTATARPRPA